MIYTVRNKVSKAPADNYTIAVCDGCKAECSESKQEGKTRGDAVCNAAIAAAHDHGWHGRIVDEMKPRARKFTSTVQLLCPECQAKIDGGAATTEGGG